MRTTKCPCCRETHSFIPEEAGSIWICRRCNREMTLPGGPYWGLIGGAFVSVLGGIALLVLGVHGGLAVLHGGLLFAILIGFFAVLALMGGMAPKTVLATFATFGGGVVLLRLFT